MSKSPWQPFLPYNAVCCRYSEIGTKGRNRGSFVRRLVEGLGRSLGESFATPRFEVERGRVYLYPGGEQGALLSQGQLEALRREIPNLPGISSVSPGWHCPRTLEALQEYVWRTLPQVVDAFLASHSPEERTYAMRVNRCDKSFPLHSAEIEKGFAEEVFRRWPQLTLDLKNPALRIGVDLRPSGIFVDYERIPGPGGLPAGSGGQALALLSGGIDSPVACYEMIRRGTNVDFVTFHSAPYTPDAGLSKICDLARVLNHFQHRGRVVAVNLLPLQKAVRDNCEEKFRTVLYRRSMMRLASVVARQFQDEALVTGENLGQVASQTLTNMRVIEDASPMMILRPLLVYDKLDIMAVARKIGTLDLSQIPVPDSCTVFAPASPATAASLPLVKANEERLDLPALLRECLRQTTIMSTLTYQAHPFPELLEQPLSL
ncbi:MAG: tRNA uracil 4-sulfurtransferase ThiI [Oligosphaeraceae bacterium]